MWCAHHAPNYLRLASPNRGKYFGYRMMAPMTAHLSKILPCRVEQAGRPGKPTLVSDSQRGPSLGVHSTGYFALKEAPGWQLAP